jgi:hypothetical protein
MSELDLEIKQLWPFFTQEERSLLITKCGVIQHDNTPTRQNPEQNNF